MKKCNTEKRSKFYLRKTTVGLVTVATSLLVTFGGAHLVSAEETPSIGQPINAPSQPEEVAPKTLILGTTETVLSDETATLGLPKDNNWSRSGGTYRWHRKIFLGWTTEEGGNTPMYRDTATLSDLKDVADGATLYPVYADQNTALSLGKVIQENKGKVTINKEDTAETTLPDAKIVENKSTGFGDDAATEKEVVAVYEENKDYTVKLNSVFEWGDNRVPALVAENPYALIKSAESVTDFSGESPTNYTYEDLEVSLDERVTVAEELTGLKLVSPLFKVAAVLDENYNVLDSTIASPANGALDTVFSFKNPDLKKKFIIRTVIRNYDTDYKTVATIPGNTVFAPMVLTSGDDANLKISNAVAKALAENGDELVFNGKIGGKIVWDTTDIMKYAPGNPFNRLLFNLALSALGESSPIETMSSVNTVDVRFVNSYKVTHKFESATPGETLPKEVDAELPSDASGKLNGETVTPGTVTNPTIKVSNGTWTFKGWEPVNKTIENADVTFIGKWEFVKDPDVNPTPTPTPIPTPNPDPQLPPVTPTPQPKPEDKTPNNKPESTEKEDTTVSQDVTETEASKSSNVVKKEALPNTGSEDLTKVFSGTALVILASLGMVSRPKRSED